MANRILSKINDRLRFLHNKQNFLDFSRHRLLANALITSDVYYACSVCINWLPTKERSEQCTATNVFNSFISQPLPAVDVQDVLTSWPEPDHSKI